MLGYFDAAPVLQSRSVAARGFCLALSISACLSVRDKNAVPAETCTCQVKYESVTNGRYTEAFDYASTADRGSALLS